MLPLVALPPVREVEPQRRTFPVGDWERGNLKANTLGLSIFFFSLFPLRLCGSLKIYRVFFLKWVFDKAF
ncbi:hypothetical protein [Nostoc sp.]|uniref:hypothetical protein n=1 Tax=Nostoc sp. TaxID=1180 RepID=UPI002FF67D19